jgi:hypothetical protein
MEEMNVYTLFHTGHRFIFLLLVAFLPLPALAQPQWQRSTPSETPDLTLFPSTMLPNLPTSETLARGDFEYEISHRFEPPITSGYDQVWGLEGPVNMRMALSYGPGDRTMVTLGFSTLVNNVDLQIKRRLFQIRNPTAPSVIALRGGVAWNTEIPRSFNRSVWNGDNFQRYAQVILNTALFNRRLGVGLVPSYLYNSNVFGVNKESTFTIGNYYQIFINRQWSVWLEYNPHISGYQGPITLNEIGRFNDSLSFGAHIDTGGHSFLLFLTNNARLNPSQYLVGADTRARSGDWRLGFGITRVL